MKTKKRQRASESSGWRGGFRLTERDRAIIRDVYLFRAMTTPQVQARHFSPRAKRPDTRCKRRLQLLTRARYLFRDEQPSKLSEGRKPYVYFLDEAGAQLMAEEANCSHAEIDWTKRANNVSWPFLEHLLATNDIRIAIDRAARHHGWTVARWIDDATLRRSEMKDYVTITGPTGASQQVAVIPDGYFILRVDTRTYHRFLETDLGTVTAASTKDGRRDWARKVKAYLEYYRTGAYHRRYGAEGLRVLTVTTTPKRLRTLRQTTEEVGGRQLFLFTTLHDLKHADPLTDPIWEMASGDGRVSLVKAQSN